MKDIFDLLTSVASTLTDAAFNSPPGTRLPLKNDQSRNPSSVPSVLNTGVPKADTLEDLELQFEHAQSMAQDSPNVFLKASMNIAAMEIFTVLNRFDTVTLSKRLEEKPELYFQLLSAQFNRAKAHLDQQKFEFKQKQAKARQRERNQKLRSRKPILITCRTLTTLASSLDRNRRPDDAQPDSVNRIVENAVPASNIAHPAKSSGVHSVPSVISVLKNNAPNPSSVFNDSNPRTRNGEPGKCPKPLVTANSGSTDLLDFDPLHFCELERADDPGVRRHREPGNCEASSSEPVWSDATADDMPCCRS
jgi:hypothetical protein